MTLPQRKVLKNSHHSCILNKNKYKTEEKRLSQKKKTEEKRLIKKFTTTYVSNCE
jgi:hypothetical protein